MNELVVGFDGSEQSRLALRWAAALAGPTAVKVVVVEAWTGGDPATADETGDGIRHDLAKTVAGLLGELPSNLDVGFEALRGSAVGVLLERVTPDSALVLGSRGRGGFAGLLLGSVSRECIEYAPCPVMVIRDQHTPPDDSAPILVGHDGSPSSAGALEWAVRLGQSTGAEVIAVHVWQAGSSEVRPRLHQRLSSAARESVEGWAREVSPAVHSLDVEGEPRMELVNLAQHRGTGLVVVGRRGQGTVRALRMGSVASYLVTSSPVPIAVIPPGPDVELP